MKLYIDEKIETFKVQLIATGLKNCCKLTNIYFYYVKSALEWGNISLCDMPTNLIRNFLVATNILLLGNFIIVDFAHNIL